MQLQVFSIKNLKTSSKGCPYQDYTPNGYFYKVSRPCSVSSSYELDILKCDIDTMADQRERTSSLDALRAKADALRAVDLGSVDKDLDELPRSSTGKKSLGANDDVSPEDDEAISEAISQAETELAKEAEKSSLVPFLSVCVIIVGVILYFILDDLKETVAKFQNK